MDLVIIQAHLLFFFAEIQVGFESRLYQFNEPLFETQYEVAIVKSIPSEQSIAVDVTITANTAQHSTRDAIADFSVGPSLRLILSLPPERQKTNVYFSILSDMILESVEDFAITILPLENSISGYAPYTPGPITRTLVQILDTFGEFKLNKKLVVYCNTFKLQCTLLVWSQ